MLNPKLLIKNFEVVHSRIAEAALRVGRTSDEVELVAISKTVSIDTIIAAHEHCGQSLFGENRADVLRAKVQALKEQGLDEQIQFDFVGNLQTNKVKWVVGNTRLIHSVNSLHLLKAIAERAQQQGIVQDLLLQLNVSGEEQKSGLDEGDIPALLEYALTQKSIRVKGFMCMAPHLPAEEVVWVFAALRKTRDSYQGQFQNESSDSLQLDKLSMGMSNDYEVAIEQGSDMVRVGSALFNNISST